MSEANYGANTETTTISSNDNSTLDPLTSASAAVVDDESQQQQPTEQEFQQNQPQKEEEGIITSTIKQTHYVPEGSDAKLVNDDPNWQPEEEIAQDSRSLVFSLVKQVKIGMDLSRVVLPTFILEPRSMLEKVSDYLTHSELLVAAATQADDPLSRMVAIVKWYLSGYYIKPKGVKKPYNPVLGEFFRCMWKHPENKTRTFFVSEQVSHHPPISAFYASNRKEGFVINGSILFRSRFMGTSVGSILEGFATVFLTHHNEEYEVTFPSAYAKGFLFGTLIMELGGQVTITCKQSGFKAEIDFKQKPLIGGGYNTIAGRIKQGNNIIFTLNGKWDSRIDIIDVNGRTTGVLWEITDDIKRNRLIRQRVPKEQQDPFESERLWDSVSKAILCGDQTEATNEKAAIEQAQRDAVKQREANGVMYHPRLFHKDESSGLWVYNHFNIQPWNPAIDGEEYELDGVIQTAPLSSSSSSSLSSESPVDSTDVATATSDITAATAALSVADDNQHVAAAEKEEEQQHHSE